MAKFAKVNGVIKPTKLIIGLGNRGPKYEKTRHNVGSLVVEGLGKRLHVAWNQKVQKSLIGQKEWRGAPLILARPDTFMNISGEVVKSLVQHFQIDFTRDLLVILDDADFTLGRIRLREKGSSGGHKGLQSVIDHLEGEGFPRLRFGIGRPKDPHQSMEDFVLGEFDEEEKKVLENLLPQAVDACLTWIEKGMPAAMTQYNG